MLASANGGPLRLTTGCRLRPFGLPRKTLRPVTARAGHELAPGLRVRQPWNVIRTRRGERVENLGIAGDASLGKGPLESVRERPAFFSSPPGPAPTHRYQARGRFAVEQRGAGSEPGISDDFGVVGEKRRRASM